MFYKTRYNSKTNKINNKIIKVYNIKWVKINY
jgi:hypothetical protein